MAHAFAEGISLKIAARPAQGSSNPYPSLFAGAVRATGLSVVHMDRSVLPYPLRADVVILHWPDEFFFQKSPRTLLKATALLATILMAKRVRRQKIVWVVHNLLPHDRQGNQASMLRNGFLSSVDGLIFLSEASRRLLLEQFSALGSLPFTVIPHGHYKAVALSPPRPLRAPLADPVHLAFVGRVERYKSPDVLARVVSLLPASSVTVDIAGACAEPELAEELTLLASRFDNVTASLGRLSDEDMERHVDGADAVVLPYRDILNSGSALLALSRGRPVLAPRLGSLVELQAEVGEAWVFLYDGALTSEVVMSFLTWLKETPRQASPDLSSHDWENVGTRVAAFLAAL